MRIIYALLFAAIFASWAYGLLRMESESLNRAMMCSKPWNRVDVHCGKLYGS